jgi:STE24 endopeptidase
VEAHRGQIPEAYRDRLDDETYAKSVGYTVEKLRFGRIETGVQASILALVLGTGFLWWMYSGLSDVLGLGIWGQAVTLFAIGVLLQLPQLPMEYYEQFSLEERFGFNKSSPGLWLSDQLKGFLVNAILLIPLTALILGIVGWFPTWWWLIGFLVFFLFMILMMVLYPMCILPLFNKLEPLPEGELKQRLMDLSDRAKFHAKTIQVIDGSKRSSHSNAYFTGFGKFRRIVLFDTLIDQLQVEELEAVLAHEIGHYRLGHIPKMLGLTALSGLLVFALIAYLSGQSWFLTGFGFSAEAGIAAVFLLFSMVSGVVTFWLTPMMSRWSRKHEYEADAFAKEVVGGAEPMLYALRKLSEKNLSNLTPHPFFSSWYYSHPSLLEREEALSKA